MIINSAPQNEAVLSNVGQVGEFRIRNSAKAFGILSSGLYANKIRAVIRELSCNAIDSHVAAGNENTPFDVHLPSDFEPWFSVRDYGTGLSGDQVTSIYTTYFESTKTDSNAFIGALGLGSKSPFSYTDNFTVVAVKDGKKGVYTAFINDEGVPSIALMNEESSNEPAGVEIRFAVENRQDFSAFRSEAAKVYTYFKQRPVVSSSSTFEFTDTKYDTVDIIPGVSAVKADRWRDGYSVAVMGNIAYPIDVPRELETLGELYRLLRCDLVMHFDIGELDFQASREGLSYIPQTINAIKNKLQALNDQLTVHISTEANAIENHWERANYLNERRHQSLWKNAVDQYIVDNSFLLKTGNNTYLFMSEKALVNDFNISLRAIGISYTYTAGSTQYVVNPATGESEAAWGITPTMKTLFVVNDTKTGAFDRAKYHCKNTPGLESDVDFVWIISAADKTKPINTEGFFASIHNPPAGIIKLASSLLKREKKVTVAAGVTILKLTVRTDRYSRYRNLASKMSWGESVDLQKTDAATTYYYVPLSGLTSLGVVQDMTQFYDMIKHSGLFDGDLYGVRKSDMETVKELSNWVNIDDYIRSKLENLNPTDVMGLVKSGIDFDSVFCYNSIISSLDANSPYAKLYNTFKDHKAVASKYEITSLNTAYKVTPTNKVNVNALIDTYTKEVQNILSRYPLLKNLSRYTEANAVAEYIKSIDLMKGI